MSKSAEELELAKEVAKKAKQLAVEREAKLLSTIRAEFYVQLSEVLKSGKVEFAVWHTGLGSPAISLGNANDLYLDTRSGDVFHKDGGAWVLALNIKGSDGKDGADGAKGDRGERGATGLAGKNGKDGKNGRDGRDGKDGRNGIDGARGKDGKNGRDGSKWFSKRGTPNYTLGKKGDFYLEESTGNYYEKVSDLSWELRGSLRGPSGPTGLIGPKGETGEGVPSGGTAGQILAKLNGDDYATEWVDAPYYQYIYNSSGSQSGNRYNDWSDLIEAINGREARIQFEQNETLPVGSWFHSFITWVGNGNNPGNGAPIITLPDGFELSDYINWFATDGLEIISTSNSPIVTQAVPTSHGFDRVALKSQNAPFFEVTDSTGLHAFFVANGGGFFDDGADIVRFTGDPYSAYIVTTEQGISPVLEADVISSSVPMIFLQLKQSSETSTGFTTQSGVDGGSVIQQLLFTNASVVGFPDGQPSGVVSTNVFDALGELSDRITVLEGYH